MFNKILVSNAWTVRENSHNFKGKHLVISILTYAERSSFHFELRDNPDRVAVLNLYFGDVLAPTGDNFCCSFHNAMEIINFVDQYRNAVEYIIVHCGAGQCRSPAVAAVLTKAFLRESDQPYFDKHRPNSKVYTECIRAAFEKGLFNE